MNKEDLLQGIRENFIQTFIDEGYTEPEAIESWEVLTNTYRDYLAKFSLPGALELKKIRETAFNRLDSIK